MALVAGTPATAGHVDATTMRRSCVLPRSPAPSARAGVCNPTSSLAFASIASDRRDTGSGSCSCTAAVLTGCNGHRSACAPLHSFRGRDTAACPPCCSQRTVHPRVWPRCHARNQPRRTSRRLCAAGSAAPATCSAASTAPTAPITAFTAHTSTALRPQLEATRTAAAALPFPAPSCRAPSGLTPVRAGFSRRTNSSSGTGSGGDISARCGTSGRPASSSSSTGPDGGLDCNPRVVTVYDLSDQVVDYEQAWAWQRALVARAAAAADAGRRGAANALLVLQHPPVYTLGAGSTTDNLRFPPGSPPIPLYRTERGGEVTYHGPGQLVVYPILDLQPLRPDLHWYLRQLEQVVIEALEAVSGLHGERVDGLTGVWVGGAKVAAVGVRAKRWISYHGLALNVVTDLSPFGRIVPCGIADRPVTSVARLLAERLAAEDPFAPPPSGASPAAGGDAAAAAAGRGGPDGEEDMLPLEQATQEDLRRMLARTGMSPLMLHESPPSTPHAAADLDDPFAPSIPDAGTPSVAADTGAGVSSSRPPCGPDAAAGTSHAASGASSTGAAASRTTASGDLLQVRSTWSAEEAMLLREYSVALMDAFEQVFGMSLLRGDAEQLHTLPPSASVRAAVPL